MTFNSKYFDICDKCKDDPLSIWIKAYNSKRIDNPDYPLPVEFPLFVKDMKKGIKLVEKYGYPLCGCYLGKPDKWPNILYRQKGHFHDMVAKAFEIIEEKPFMRHDRGSIRSTKSEPSTRSPKESTINHNHNNNKAVSDQSFLIHYSESTRPKTRTSIPHLQIEHFTI
ncbi:uncharacterized protein LOC128393840 [Panonychus citri]|uniref:uncharacterized protein LOC128393840 n=1 Tax=Panonychus citri TaxID=50023 RepID=UPI002307318E|nr:uncharacterized protein LOC128393840 [Panonychus citri]